MVFRVSADSQAKVATLANADIRDFQGYRDGQVLADTVDLGFLDTVARRDSAGRVASTETMAVTGSCLNTAQEQTSVLLLAVTGSRVLTKYL